MGQGSWGTSPPVQSEGGRGHRPHSLVAAVPLPGVPRPGGEEVRRALVLHALGEAQQHPHVVVCGLGGVGCAAGQGGRQEWGGALHTETQSGPTRPRGPRPPVPCPELKAHISPPLSLRLAPLA